MKSLEEIEKDIKNLHCSEDIKSIMLSWNFILSTLEQTIDVCSNRLKQYITVSNNLFSQIRDKIIKQDNDIDNLRNDIDYVLDILTQFKKKEVKKGIE